MDELATVRASAERLRQVTRETALAPGGEDPWYRVVRIELSPGGFEGTKPGGDAGPAVHTRYDAAIFDSYASPDDPCLAALGAEATLAWLDWLDGEETTVRFLGDSGERTARAVELRSGDDRVEVGPLPTDVVDPDLSTGRPGDFDGETASDGETAPGDESGATRIETDGETLERLVDAAAIVDDESVPVVVEDGEFRLAVVGEMMHGRGQLSARVSGSDCAHRYGDDLTALARTLDGPVVLRVAPDGELAVVQEADLAARRYVLSPTM